MDPPWSTGGYQGHSPADIERIKRDQRNERILPFWEDLSNDIEPRTNKPSILILMQDLKDEGNVLFKEGKYNQAWMHYRNALFIARILETRFYHEVDKEFLSTLFSNRALCCLKIELYEEAANDCDSAIRTQPNNVKAYYRKVQALKAMKKYKEALEAAEIGHSKQPAVFKDQIEELKQLEDSVSVGSKAKPVSKTSEISISGAKHFPKSELENEWLVGTNALLAEKQREQAKARMPRKKKAQQNHSIGNRQLSGKPATQSEQEANTTESDTDSSDLGEDEKFAATLLNVRSAGLKERSSLKITQPKYLKDDDALWSFPHSPDADVDILPLAGFKTVGPIGSKAHSSPTKSTMMGLDEFSPTGKGQMKYSTNLTSGSPTHQPSKPPNSTALIDWPLKDEFDFKLACRDCFVKIGEGVKGYRYVADQSHGCTKNILIVRLKSKQGLNWIKIRPRAETTTRNFSSYKICQQFQAGQPCKVGQERCSFPHHQPEMRLWTLDRGGLFSINGFITQLRNAGIDSSMELPAPPKETKQEQYIPGLNYSRGQTRDPRLQPAPLSVNKQPDLQQQQQQLQQTPPTSIPMKQPLLPHPSPQQIRPPPFKSGGFSFPPPIRSMMHPPPSVRPVMHQPPPVRPMLPQQSQYSSSTTVLSDLSPPPTPFLRNLIGHPSSVPSSPVWQKHVNSQPLSSEYESVGCRLENPLPDYEFRIMCKQCLCYNNFPGRYIYNPHPHKCEENMLAMHNKNSIGMWLRVRERKNHREFPGNYILCHSIEHKHPDWCRYGEEGCSFAHNIIEQILWTLEKDGKFNVSEFIIQNRSQVKSRGYSLTEIMAKHGGYFTFVCRACFYSQPPRISLEEHLGTCNGTERHSWMGSKIMAHFGAERVTVINKRGFLHKTAFFKICRWLHFCRNQLTGECRFAHSMVERDVWMMERDLEMTQEEIVAEASQILQNGRRISDNRAQGPPFSYQHQHSASHQKPPPSVLSFANVPVSNGPSQQLVSSEQGEGGDLDCPHIIQVICGTCWKNGTRSPKDGDKDRCTKLHNLWHQIRIFMLLPGLKEIRPLPKKIPNNLHFVLCKYIVSKNKCEYNLGGPCQFAHSEEEIDVWKWMGCNGVKTLDELAEASLRSAKNKAAKAKIPQGESVVAVSKPAVHIVAPSDLSFNPHYCQYCGVQCNSQKQWDDHCASERHNFNVNSDKDHQWNFRQPPWGISASGYELCAKHQRNEQCQYSHVPDMYNLCNFAHSQEELDEWCERYEWRQMKREMAKQQKVFSFMDQLWEKYEKTDAGIKVLSEELDGVNLQVNGDQHIYREEKNATYSWTFVIHSSLSLFRTALLLNRDRLHFSIQVNDGKNHQIAPGDMFEDVDAFGKDCYKIDVQFTGGMFGSFSQWVVFDFGSEPVLVHKLSVEVGSQSVHEHVRSLRQMLTFDRWTSQNREIVCQLPNGTDTFSEHLLSRYKEPSSSEQVVTQNSIIAELNRNNYIHKMHKLLELEEMTRHQIISSYNLVTGVEILEHIDEVKGSFYPRAGELFARVPLTENLTEDTNAGKLILTSVKKVLLAPQNNSHKTVYEANIVREDNFNYDGRGKDYIYLCLPPPCVQQLNLKRNTKEDIEIQFQMDRLHFCRMHYAIDCLKDSDIVFPDIAKVNPQWSEKHVLKISSKVLNEDQMTAVRHIVAERSGYTPPFIMFGPFGTGKTETLAQAAMVLLKERPETRILICAQSNSAADLYITKHLDPFLRRTGVPNLLQRIYIKERRVNTVPQEVQKYCVFSNDHCSFEFPSKWQIQLHRIVITTVETSLHLTKLELQGHFTHIFVDEAAQALECETIMPLSLATDKTCIVLTGDHMQMSPKVYSTEARRLNFHVSLLQRLYQYYESSLKKLRAQKSSSLNIFLSINYRTKMEILRFISAIFYGGPDSLKAHGHIPSVVEITPLVFYAVQGREVQDQDSTSYYNLSEVEEIVEQVEELYNNWPAEWGEKQATEIQVVTPYYEQVVHIRHALRRRRVELRRVNVSRIHDVQGKEFRALFISTCRTQHLLDSPHVEGVLKSPDCDGDIGDFGFLSDPKLLNTALTRAQSFVGVVGDPVAVCAIGECVQVWRTYLKHCHNMRSLYPKTLSYESIKNKVIELQMSPIGLRLQEVTELCRQSSRMPKLIPSDSKPLVSNSHKERNVWTNSPLTPVPTAAAENFFDMHPKLPQISRQFSLDDWDIDFMIAPDDVIKQLAKEVVRAEKLHELQEKAKTEGTVPPLEQSVELDDEPLKIECIKVKEEEGYAVVYYNAKWAEEGQKRKLLSEADAGRDFDSDIDLFEEEDEDTGKKQVYKSFSVTHLREFLKSEPNRYKHCVLNIESSRRMFARVVNYTSPIQEIIISSRQRCGQGFHSDEVVVEVLPDEDETEELSNTSGKAVSGQVVGILRRALDPRFRSFVCTVELNNTGFMIPLNRGIPRMYNLSTKTRLQRVRKGHVCVYQFTKDKEIKFSHYEKIDPNDPTGKLFVVRYLKWEPTFHSPLGIVVGVVPAGRTSEDGMQILDMEYNVPKKYKQETELEVETVFHHDFRLPQDVYSSRNNYTERWCFTIDASSTDDLDDAFSIEQLSDGNYEVGVHIADVSYFIRRDSCIDAEALQRGSSFYPLGKDPIHMLPHRLSTDLCSLKPSEDRLTLSIFMTVTASGEIKKVQAKKCIINSKQRYSYQEVEDILHEPIGAQTEFLKSCITVLYQISLLWRRQRLGNSHLVQNLEPVDKLTPKAHQMVEELMITTNYHVAKKLLEHYPQCTPLKCQSPPNPDAADQWKEEHASDAINSVALTKPFLPGFKTCNCRVACTCIFTYIRQHGIQAQESFNILKELWKTICGAADVGNLELVQQHIVAPENHPQLAIALSQLHKLQEKSVYVCSEDVDSSNQGHYALNLSAYTTFTSPIRRYMDLVVHRMVAAMIDNQPCPYSRLDIKNLCAKCTDANSKANRYHQAVQSLHFSLALKNKPLVLFPVVESVDVRAISLKFPTVKNVPVPVRNVGLNLLAPSDKPEMHEESQEIKLKWQERIYDTLESRVTNQTLSRPQRGGVELDPDRFVNKIPAFQWQRLLSAIREENFEKLQNTVAAVREQVENIVPDGRFAEDVTSSTIRDRKVNHFAEFSLSVHSCMIVQVQVAAELSKGLLTPRLQLLNIVPRLDVCLEHRSSPVTCFSSLAVISATRQVYTNEDAYQKLWLPVLSMEAAHSVVSNGENVIIHNVFIHWDVLKSSSNCSYIGQFQLPLNFCKEKEIKFSGDVHFDDLFEQINSSMAQSYFLDYLCVRYSGLQLPSDSAVQNSVAMVVNSAVPVCWVGHCCITSVTKERNDHITIELKLNQSSVPLPQQLYGPGGGVVPCSVEWIPKPLPNRRTDFALRCLGEASGLAKDIATGRKPVDNLDLKDVAVLKNTHIDAFRPPNPLQDQIIQMALKQPFTLIQGPPGTGKTVTGARLACLYVERNRVTPRIDSAKPRSQVLYCGPSNKSVDVVTAFLRSMGGRCPRLVRVYSERIERNDYPLPRDPVPPKKQKPPEVSSDPQVKQITLHLLIRAPSNPYSQQILEYDTLFGLYPDDITEDQIKDYLKIITAASTVELQQAEIILSTCSASASPKMSWATNIKQLIIDECGMSTEPESMIPIILFREIQQIVLIGDHKQLQPIVLENTAKELGLQRSLFERYADKALMLTTQYRMHEGIAHFPSNYFYEGKLQCGNRIQIHPSPLKIWPNGANKPIVFCHIVGKEETLTVTTAEGSEQSKSNEREVDYAVLIASMLVNRFRVSESEIVIMSQYRSQCAAIQRKLQDRSHRKVNVSTVIASQGSEWDYVIMSTVRSLHKSKIEQRPTLGWIRRNLGFISDEHQVNVAITRARKGLIIIGNKNLLRCDPLWDQLLTAYKQDKKVVNADDFVRNMRETSG